MLGFIKQGIPNNGLVEYFFTDNTSFDSGTTYQITEYNENGSKLATTGVATLELDD